MLHSKTYHCDPDPARHSHQNRFASGLYQLHNIGIQADCRHRHHNKNLDSSFNGANTSAGTPAAVAMVVITDAPMKNRMKNGNTCLIEIFPAPSPFSRLVRISASTSVIGIIARVRVSFTVTALSSVWLPSPYRLSQVEAAAVTDEVSFTAVPANTPNASPELLQSRGNLPMSETKSPPAR